MSTGTRRMRRLPLVVLVATGLVASATSSPAGVRTLGNQRLGTDTMVGPGRDAPGLAVNPRDPRHVVAINVEVLGRTCEHRVSRDGGRTWKLGLLRAPAGYPARPCDRGQSAGNMDGGVAFGTGPNVYASFTARNADGVDMMLVARSTDGGSTFGVGVPAAPGTYPKLAVQPRPRGDRLFLVGRTPSVARSDDGGRTWSAAVPANAVGSSAAEATQPALGSGGALYVAWRTNNSGADNTLVLGKSVDAGATWVRTDVTTVPTGGSNFPRLAADPRGGGVYVAYGRNPAPRGTGPNPGGVHARDHFIPKDSDVMVAASRNGGASFGRPVRVNDDLVGNGIAQRHPGVFVGPGGRVDVVWHDRRHGFRSPSDAHAGNGEARLGDTYFASSADGGKTYSVNRRVTDRSINNDMGLDYKCCSYWNYGPVAVPLGASQVLVAWSDTREGDVDTEAQQIYLGRVELRASGALPVQRLVGTSEARAVGASRLAYPAGAEAVLASSGFANSPRTAVIIVNPKDRGLLLAGSVLARAHLGTVLPATGGGLSPAVVAEVKRLGPVAAVLVGDETSVPASVNQQLVAAGVPADRVARITGASSADVVARVAATMDRRSTLERTAVPVVKPAARAFDEVVVVNEASPESAAAAGLASTFRLPVLLVGRDSVPAETSRALRELNVRSALVVGGPGAVSEAVLAQLPEPRRLAGTGVVAVSHAALREAQRRGSPGNVVYVAHTADFADAAYLAPAVARAGGLLLLSRSVRPADVERQLVTLRLRDGADRMVLLSRRAS